MCYASHTFSWKENTCRKWTFTEIVQLYKKLCRIFEWAAGKRKNGRKKRLRKEDIMKVRKS